MRTTTRRLAALILCIVTGPALAAPEWREVPYVDLYEVFSRDFVEGAKYARLWRTFTVDDDAFRLEDLRLVVAAADGPIEVMIADDGRVEDFPVSDALRDENPPVRTNAPAEKLSLAFAFQLTTPPVERLPYATIVEMADEYDHLVRRQGMLARMMMPDAQGLFAAFGAGVAAHARIGDEVIEADADGNLTIPLKRKWRRALPEVAFSAMPTMLSLRIE